MKDYFAILDWSESKVMTTDGMMTAITWKRPESDQMYLVLGRTLNEAIRRFEVLNTDAEEAALKAPAKEESEHEWRNLI
jgi:hypothetical protein